MAGAEKCSKYPSMLKAHCSHCQGTELGTADNTRYSTKEGRYNGSPVIEVLANGGPIHSWDKNFRFGLRKAQMLVACVPVLREFGQSNDEEKRMFESRTVEDLHRSFRVRISVVMHEDFENSYGIPVQRPWLFLRALPPEDLHLGLGTAKCRAICSVQEDLQRWLQKYDLQD